MDYSTRLQEKRDNAFQKLVFHIGNKLVQTSSKPLLEMDKEIRKIESIQSVLSGFKQRYQAVAKCKDMKLRANLHHKLDKEMKKIENDVRNIKTSLYDWKLKV